MDVSVEVTGNLSRRLKFVVPLAEVEVLVARRMQRLRKTVRIDGFRSGKVPDKVLRQRYGASVFREVASAVIESSYKQAIADHKLLPAGQPDFRDTRVLPGQDLHFVADIELYPEFDLAPLEDEKLEKPVAEVNDKDVMAMIDRTRLRHAEWRAVQRRPRDGDRVRVRFEEKIEVFAIDDNNELLVRVGESGLEGDFGVQLLKCEPGDRKKIRIRLPGDYPNTRWAGKKLKFRVEVIKVEEGILPDLDQPFFEQLGVREGGLGQLKEIFREGMEYELKQKLQEDLKGRVMDLLLRKNNIDLPRTMVRYETERIRAELTARLGDEDEKDKDNGRLDDELLKERSERNVKLGVIMRRVAESQQLEVSNQEFEAGLARITERHENAEAVRKHYRSDPQARSGLRGAILEEKVFEWVLGQVQLREKRCTFDEVVRSR